MLVRTFVMLAAVAGMVRLEARDALAQCPPGQILHGQVNPADDSIPPSPATVTVFYCTNQSSGWGTVNVCPVYSAACVFSAGAATYFGELNPSPTAWCVDTPTGLSCHPQDQDVFNFALFSSQGAIDGHVTRMPSGLPAVGYGVLLQRRNDAGAWIYSDHGLRTTDSSGYYTFDDAGPNHWGVYVYREQGASGPGTADYRSGGGPTADYSYAHISSNQKGTIDLFVKDPGHEEPERCGSCQQPPTGPSPSVSGRSNLGSGPVVPGAPCNVGNPVSVTTGNAYLDQTDTTIPGAGLGLLFARSYNSKNIDPGEYGAFGPGWSHSYEKRLTFPVTGLIKLRSGDGMPSFYQDQDNGDGTFLASMPFSKESQIVRISATEYVLSYRRGGSERYVVPSGGTTARLDSLTDASGNVTTLAYDSPAAAGRLVGIADPGGRQLTLAYSGSDPQPRQLLGPAGLIATFTYAPVGSPANSALQSVTYADGDGDTQPDGAYTFAYHPSGQLWTVTDGAGKVVETHLYTGDRVTQTSRSGKVEKYTLAYDDQSNTTTVTDALGNVTTYRWQNVWGARRVYQIVGPCSSCGGSGSDVQEWTYDVHGRVTSRKDGEGNLTTYEYDAEGKVMAVNLPPATPGAKGLRTAYTYLADGRVQSRTDPNGRVTNWTYVAAGPQTMTETVSAGVTRTTAFAYTASAPKGKLEFVTDPLNKQTQLHYLLNGDLEWIQDPMGILHRRTFEYDAMGRQEKANRAATLPANDVRRRSYDTLGRVWRVTNPNGTFWRYSYDGGGRRVLTRDPHDGQTQSEYDAWGRLSRIIDASLGETEFQYDFMSNLVLLTDARDKTTAFEYDGYHRLKKITSAGSPEPFEERTYDHAGRLKTRTDRKGVTTTYTYDGLGRLTAKTSDSSTAVAYWYDGNGDKGFLTAAGNSADSLSWDYDLAGQLVSEASTLNGTTVSYVTDLAGRRTKLRLNGSDLLTYAYQDDGELDTITRAAGVVFDFSPDAAHRRLGLSFPNGTATDYGYDLLSNLSLVRLKRGATILGEIAYASDDLGNRASRTEGTARLDYGFDALSRLTTVQGQTGGGPSTTVEQYTLDAVGNRLTALGVAGPWTYGDRNELLSYNGITFGYDANGSQVSRSGSPARTYEWYVDQRLKRVLDNGTEVALYLYDPLGRRVMKSLGGGSTRFAYDGDDVLFEQGPSGNVTYLHGPGTDEPLAREAGGVRTYYHADGLNSIVKRTDAAGSVIASTTYDSFGQATGLPNGYAFAGREWDAESGLYSYRARYYDPRAGRFISEDPMGLKGGINPFLYVFDNPVTWVDPTGYGAVAPKPTPSPTPSPSPDPCKTKTGCWRPLAPPLPAAPKGELQSCVQRCNTHQNGWSATRCYDNCPCYLGEEGDQPHEPEPWEPVEVFQDNEPVKPPPYR